MRSPYRYVPLEIGKEAFKGCEQLREVYLVPSTSKIGERAFENCTNLYNVYFDDVGGRSLRNPVPEENSRVQEYSLIIGEYAFAGCINLQGFEAYPSITKAEIEKHAFEGCRNMSGVAIPSIDSISDNAFKDCTNLVSVNINEYYNNSSLTQIGVSAFENCESFVGFVFLYKYYDSYYDWTYDISYGGQFTIDEYGNYYDPSKALLILPNDLKTLGDRAFYGCESIKNVQWDFPADEIGAEIFAGCKGLIDVTFNNTPKFAEGMFKGCEKLQGFISPSLARSSENPIAVPPLESLFEDCKKLQFEGSDKYSPIEIFSGEYSGITSIGARAFKNCQKFGPEWEIPAYVTEIGKEAFYGCKNLSTVYAYNSSLEYVGANAFPSGTRFVTDDDWIQLLLVEGLDSETYAETYWDGTIYGTDEYAVFPGAVVITEDGASLYGPVGEEAQVTIESGTEASIESGATVTFEKDATFFIYGDLKINGTIKSLGGEDSEVTLYVPDLSNVTFGENGKLEGKFKLVTNLTSSMISINYGTDENGTEKTSKDYTGSAVTLEPSELIVSTVFGPENDPQIFVYKPEKDYTYDYPDGNPTIGTAKVVVTPTENGNLLGRARTKNFTIGKATPTVAAGQPTIDKAKVTITAEVSGGVGSGYDGTMTIQVLQDDKVKLVKNIQMDGDSTSVEYTWNNLYNGKYTVKAIYNGDRYHTSATSANQVEFTINVSGNDAPLGTGGSGGSGGGGGGGGVGGGSTGGQAPAIPDPNANPNNSEPIDWGVITLDPVKGYVSSNYGIMARDSQDKHSTWKVDEISALIWGGNKDDYWQLQYPNGSVAKGSTSVDENGQPKENYLWEQVNGKWWVFDSKGYAKMGWVFDPNYQAWFYIHVKHGMMTGWIQIDNLWYYLHEVSDGRKGCMYAATRTPDGYYVREDGSWDGKPKQ